MDLDGLLDVFELPGWGVNAILTPPDEGGFRNVIVNWTRNGEQRGGVMLVFDPADPDHFTVNSFNLPEERRGEDWFGLMIARLRDWGAAEGFTSASGYGTAEMETTLWRLGLNRDPKRRGHMTTDLTDSNSMLAQYGRWRTKGGGEPAWRKERFR